MNVVSPKSNPGVTEQELEVAAAAARAMSTRPIAWGVLLICLLATAGGYYVSLLHSELTARKQFDDETIRIATAFTERLQVYQDVLHGGVGLYAASASVERSEWRAYVNSVSVNTRFPGVDAIGFAAYVPRERLEQFLAETRADKTPDYNIQNPGTNADLFLVKYIEPEESHHGMLGWDLGIDPGRRLVAEKSRDSAGPATTGRITLTDHEGETHPGFMMMLPVFRHATTNDSVAERRANLEGWVYARFVTDEFMKAILALKPPTLEFELFDGAKPTPEKILFASKPSWAEADYQPRYVDEMPLSVGGSVWSLRFTTTPAFDATIRRSFSLMVGIGGGCISLLLFGIAWVLSRTRERALIIASKMTAALRESNQRLQTEIGEREYAQRRVATQYSVTRVLADSPTLREAARKIIQAMCENLHWDLGAMWLLNPEIGSLHCVEVWQRSDLKADDFTATTVQLTLQRGEGLPGRVWAERQPAWISDLPSDRNFPRARQATKAGLSVAFGFPVLMGDQFLGVMEFFSREKTPPDTEQLAMMATAGSQIGQFIDRKKSVDALKDSEAIYHSLVESLPMSIVRKDGQGRIIFANHRYCVTMGKPLAELLGQTESKLFPTEIARKHERQDQAVMENGSTIEIVEELPGPDGETQFVQVIKSPVRGGSGLVVGVLAIYWDVTDKQHAEQKLEHERFLLHTLMEYLPDRIYFKDSQSRFLRNSRGHLQRFGLTDPSEAIGKSDFDFFTDEHAQQAFEDEQRVMKTGEPLNVEEKETWPDGSTTWALSTKLPLRNEHGETVGTFGISRDITDRKRAEEAMRRAKETAEEASRTKSQFLANMSHELRTPLNSVIGFANILLKNKAHNLRVEELTFLERILANGKHLLSLINQILDLSKIESRKIELNIAPVALDVLVRETVAQQEGQVREHPVQLLAAVPDKVAPLDTDAEKLKQIIINLIGNALKFTERGSVTVRIVAEPPGGVPKRLEVVDTGIGIPKDRLGAIFEAFQQADSSTSRKYGGTGLGLTISQALCQMMGFHIEVASEVGKGSTFAVVFEPAVAPPEGPSTSGSRANAASLPRSMTAATNGPHVNLTGKHVLVIDDENDSRILLSRMLEEFGCRVTAANSGLEGLRLARSSAPDIITVDLLMPNVDGWEVVRQINADPQLRFIPTVVVSVIARENRARLIGSVEVLQKPVAKEELFAVLQRSLRPANPKVLIVDDDADTHRILATYLEEISAEIQSAANGQEALKSLTSFTPDLILLDLMMPHMDGVTFLTELRAAPPHRNIPVVVITAKELNPEETAHLRANTHHVMKKPEVFGEDLRRLFDELLQRTRPQPPPPAAPAHPRPAG